MKIYLVKYVFVFAIISNILFSQNKAQWIKYSEEQNVKAMAFEGDFVWVGAMDRLVRINTATNEKVVFTIDNMNLGEGQINSIAVNSKGIKWIGTANGLLSFDNKKWSVYTSKNSKLPSDHINTITIEKNDILWIGTGTDNSDEKGGLVRFDGNDWIVYNRKSGNLPNDAVLSVYIDKDNIKWIGTKKGLTRFSGEDWIELVNDKGGFENHTSQSFLNISGITSDKKNNIFIYALTDIKATEESVIKYDKDDFFVLNDKNMPPGSLKIFNTSKDGEGNIWMVMNGNEPLGISASLIKTDGNKMTRYLNENFSAGFNSVQSMLIDKSGNKWLGTKKNGIIVFNENGIKGITF